MSTSISLRDAAVRGVQAVEALWNAAYAVSSSRSSAQDISALLAHGPNARVFLAEADGVLVGTLIATFDGWRGNMYRLAVQPGFQRKGIATQLVEAAHSWLVSLGCARITALVEGDHAYATGFWQSAGYEHDVGMRRYHLDTGKHRALFKERQ